MTTPSVIARPYARAAFEVARDTDQLAQWQDSLQLVAAVAADSQIRTLLKHPAAAREDLINVLLDSVARDSRVDLRPLLTVLAENSRLSELPQIAEQFSHLKAEHEQVQRVDVTSAVELTAAQKQALEQRLGDRYGRSIEASYGVDESIIGGLRVSSGDTVQDASLSDQLRRLADAINQA